MIHSQRAKEGWMIVDNRAAPPDPLVPRFVEGGVTTCSHCQHQIIRNPAQPDDLHLCWGCNHYICDDCKVILMVKGKCIPFAKVLDDLETSILRQRAL